MRIVSWILQRTVWFHGSIMNFYLEGQLLFIEVLRVLSRSLKAKARNKTATAPIRIISSRYIRYFCAETKDFQDLSYDGRLCRPDSKLWPPIQVRSITYWDCLFGKTISVTDTVFYTCHLHESAIYLILYFIHATYTKVQYISSPPH